MADAPRVEWVLVRVPFRAPFVTAAGAWMARVSWIVTLRDADGRCGVGESVEDDKERVAALDAARLDLAGFKGARPHPWVGVNATIGAVDVDAGVDAAVRAVAAGFRTLKLKAGPGEGAAALAGRLLAVRTAVGEDTALRLDVNGTGTFDEAVERLRALDAVRLQYVEQPLAMDAVADARRLRGRAGVAIALDEPVTSPAAARALLDAEAADVLVVKPARVGGPSAVAEIAVEAVRRGVPVVISSMFETGIGLAAGLASAAALPDVERWRAADRDHGLATADMLEDDLITAPFEVVDGRMRAPGGSGAGALGVMLDLEAVGRYRVDVA